MVRRFKSELHELRQHTENWRNLRFAVLVIIVLPVANGYQKGCGRSWESHAR